MATLDETFGQEPRTQTMTAPKSGMDAPGFSGYPWPLWLRIVFRFVFCYFVLYNLPFPLTLSAGTGGGLFPGASYLIAAYTRMWHAFVPWVGAHILHLSRPITYFRTGSGDTTSDWVQWLCYLVFAAIATLVWTLLDRRRKQYRALHEGLRIYVRYALALTLLVYGFSKFFHGQFGPPGLTRLAEPYGDFSPMGVLWASIGSSYPYMWFTGAVEVSGGLLLFFRRTTMLGALVAASAMLEVSALNYFYDVPVKLFSTNLLLMAIFLLIPDLRRLANTLVLNRTATPANLAFPWRRRWMKPTRLVLKTLVVVFAIYGTTVPLIRMMHGGSMRMAKSPLYGIYNVEASAQNGTGVASLDKDAMQWRTVVFEYRGAMSVLAMDDSRWSYPTRYDAAKKQVAISTGFDVAEDPSPSAGQKRPKAEPVGVLTYSQPDANHLVLQGTFMNQPVNLRLRKVDASKFLLLTRGYHWITEISFNR